MPNDPPAPGLPWRRAAALLLLPGGRAVTLARGDVLLASGVVEAVAASVVPAGQAAWLVAVEHRQHRRQPIVRIVVSCGAAMERWSRPSARSWLSSTARRCRSQTPALQS